MLIGYMRVSTAEQSLDLQRDALEKAGCRKIYEDVCSGRATELRIPRKMGTDSTRSWALIPRHRGQPFQTSGRLADRFMESGLSRWVKRF